MHCHWFSALHYHHCSLAFRCNLEFRTTTISYYLVSLLYLTQGTCSAPLISELDRTDDSHRALHLSTAKSTLNRPARLLLSLRMSPRQQSRLTRGHHKVKTPTHTTRTRREWKHQLAGAMGEAYPTESRKQRNLMKTCYSRNRHVVLRGSFGERDIQQGRSFNGGVLSIPLFFCWLDIWGRRKSLYNWHFC